MPWIGIAVLIGKIAIGLLCFVTIMGFVLVFKPQSNPWRKD